MDYREIEGALNLIRLEGEGMEAYLDPEYSWEKVEFDFDAPEEDADFNRGFVAAVCKAGYLYVGKDKVQVPEDGIEGWPQMLIGQTAGRIISTLALYGVRRPKSKSPEGPAGTPT